MVASFSFFRARISSRTSVSVAVVIGVPPHPPAPSPTRGEGEAEALLSLILPKQRHRARIVSCGRGLSAQGAAETASRLQALRRRAGHVERPHLEGDTTGADVP